jgi:hypothetical protein
MAQMENGGGLIEAATTPKEDCIWRNPDTCKDCRIKYCQIKEEIENV